jgi:hypothetical protein
LVPQNRQFCISSRLEFLQNLLAGDIPRPLINASQLLHARYGRFVKKMLPYGSFTRKELRMGNRTRANEFKLRLSDDEMRLLNEKWKLSGLPSRNAYLRQLIIYGFVYDIDYADLREYNTALSRIGNNLNQIARKVNTNGEATAADIKEAKEIMEKIWLTQKSMLSKHPSVHQ